MNNYDVIVLAHGVMIERSKQSNSEYQCTRDERCYDEGKVVIICTVELQVC